MVGKLGLLLGTYALDQGLDPDLAPLLLELSAFFDHVVAHFFRIGNLEVGGRLDESRLAFVAFLAVLEWSTPHGRLLLVDTQGLRLRGDSGPSAFPRSDGAFDRLDELVRGASLRGTLRCPLFG